MSSSSMSGDPKIEELLAASEGLVTGLPQQSKRYKRNLAELREGAIDLATSGNRLEEGQYDNSIHRLPGFDASALYSVNQDTHVSTPLMDPSAQLDNTDIEGFLANYHDTILLKAHSQAKMAIEDNIRELQIDWASADWHHAREAFMNPHSNAWAKSNAGAALPGTIRDASKMGLGGGSSGTSPAVLSPTLAAHCRALQAMQLHEGDGCKAMRMAMDLPSARSDARMNTTQYDHYKSWLALLESMVKGERQGSFALVGERDSSGTLKLGTERTSWRRAREFLERTVAEDQNAYNARMTQARGLVPCVAQGDTSLQRAADVATYVNALAIEGLIDLNEGTKSKNDYGKPVPLWPLVNFCLCAGYYEDALAEVRLLRHDGDVQALEVLLHAVVEVMCHARAPTASRAQLQSAFDRCVELSHQSLDQYQLAVLRLVTDALNYTADEYEIQTWSMLWFEEWSEALQTAGVQSSTLCTRDAFMERNGAWHSKLDVLVDIGDTETPLLKDYVDLGEEDPSFDPVLHMLALHRFGPAVDYLRTKKQLFAAVHILLICLHYGLVAPNDPLHPYSPIPTSPREVLDLFVEADEFGLFNTAEATDYVMALSNYKWIARAGELGEHVRARAAALSARQALQHMLAQCARATAGGGRAHALLGDVNQRMRQYRMSSTDANDMLRAAGHAVRKQNDAALSAVELYKFAGPEAEEDIVRLYCKHLSATVFAHESPGSSASRRSHTDGQEAHRRFWLERAQDHLEQRLLPRRQELAPPLRRSAEFLQLLVTMGHFAELFYEGSYDAAIQSLDRVGMELLPSRPADVSAKVELFEDASHFDVPLPMSSFFKTVMQCLVQRRAQMVGMRGDVASLQARARAINILVGQLPMLTSDVTIECNRMLDRVLI